jgi:hypothetical protein
VDGLGHLEAQRAAQESEVAREDLGQEDRNGPDAGRGPHQRRSGAVAAQGGARDEDQEQQRGVR